LRPRTRSDRRRRNADQRHAQQVRQGNDCGSKLAGLVRIFGRHLLCDQGQLALADCGIPVEQ
jgi:hypothetical protein